MRLWFVAHGNICMLVVVVVSDLLGTRSASGSQSTMAGVLHECTRVEQHVVLHFLWAKGLSTEEVHHEMHPVYGDNSRKTAFNCIQEFNKKKFKFLDFLKNDS